MNQKETKTKNTGEWPTGEFSSLNLVSVHVLSTAHVSPEGLGDCASSRLWWRLHSEASLSLPGRLEGNALEA